MQAGQVQTTAPALCDPLAGRADAHVPRLVRHALDHGRARLALQPVKARGSSRIVFHEALLRLSEGSGLVLSAAHFMPWVEDGPLGRDLDCAALRLGLAWLERNDSARLSLNLSALSVVDKGWRRTLLDWVRRHPDAACRLILEMSEAAALRDPEATQTFMAQMQPLGLCFALDEFGARGTGAGAGAGKVAIAEFIFDMVKIDRTLAAGIDRCADRRAGVRDLVAMARDHDLLTVAQGVERASEAEVFAALGVDCLQGYLIGRPVVRP